MIEEARAPAEVARINMGYNIKSAFKVDMYFFVIAAVFGRAYNTIARGAKTITIIIAAWRIVSIIKPKNTEIAAETTNITTERMIAGPVVTAVAAATPNPAPVTRPAILEMVADA